MSPSPANPQSNSSIDPATQLATQSVIAAYIHEISDRHRRRDQSAERPAGLAAND
jgi:hypothetical protein